jgi:U4/U6 small nuclear ribonucleoprotein PRP4
MADSSHIFFGAAAPDVVGSKRTNMEASSSSGSSSSDDERLALTEESRAALTRQNELVMDMKLQMRFRTIAAPTLDNDVRMKLRSATFFILSQSSIFPDANTVCLREFGEPITLFGEGPADRRDRLKRLLSKMEVEGIDVSTLAMPSSSGGSAPGKAEHFFTEGTATLQAARMHISRYSLLRAKMRVEHAKKSREAAAAPNSNSEDASYPVAEYVSKEARVHADLANSLKTFNATSSQIGDARPLSGCALSPCATIALTPSWGGSCIAWSLPDCKEKVKFLGHRERCCDAKFNPLFHYPSAEAESVATIASCGADQTVRLWSLSRDLPLATLTGHTDRVNRVAFHPSGRFLASASFDLSWRLWDIEHCREILLQEGHSRAVYNVAMQCDGALAATVGLDAYVRVWDLRTGRNVATLDGHNKQVLAVDWSCDGYHFATAGEDNQVKLWDMRKRKAVYTIPAHSSLISSIKFIGSGDFLITGSYDSTIKIWDGLDMSPVHTLHGHENKIMGLDVSNDCKSIISASFDRTWKLWGL